MDKRQKSILAESITVIIITVVAVVGLVNFKDYVNRSETLQAMRVVGAGIIAFQEKNGMLPQEGYIEQLREEIKKGEIKGGVRMGNLQYRGLFIEPHSEPNEILLYSKKEYSSSFLDDGYAVLFLDGTVKWMDVDKFNDLLSHQQTDYEKHIYKK